MTTVWKSQLTFGLVSIPIRLFRAARKERVQLHYVAKAASAPEDRDEDIEIDIPAPEQPRRAVEPVQPTPRGVTAVGRAEYAPEPEPVRAVERVHQSIQSTADERPIPRKDLLKGYEAAPGRYVTFRNEELRRLRPATSTQMEIVRSVAVHEVDPVYLETSYYAVPDRGGEHAYSLLFAALRDTGHAALAQVVMHGREHIVVIRAGRKGLLAHTMYYADEVKAETEYRADTAGLNPKEIDLAKKFVDAIAGPFAPEEFKDTYRENLKELIAGKIGRRAVAAAAGAASETRAEAPPVLDIMDALKKSLELKRKPAASERKASPATKVTEIGSRKRPRTAAGARPL